MEAASVAEFTWFHHGTVGNSAEWRNWLAYQTVDLVVAGSSPVSVAKQEPRSVKTPRGFFMEPLHRNQWVDFPRLNLWVFHEI